ncbi:GIY-YIG nuclease family protein [Patescibacteria group bacterium]|nr:GIY-YIG nuclease family protein [Patescibacteria group bacterium]
MYIGKAKNLRSRVSSYFINKDLGEKTKNLVYQIEKIKTVGVSSEIESLLLEANLIKKYKPKYNIKLTDGKFYPSIRITVKDKYPKVLVARQQDDPKSIYFGPYPDAGKMRLVLKIIRKIFPYESVLNHPKKICLYNHIGLCPCAEVLGDNGYKKNVKRIIKFLKGETKKVIADLENDRNSCSKRQEYEEAKKLQEKIDAIKRITAPVYKPFEYIINPNFKSDIRFIEQKELASVLKEKGVNVENLNRIECFDISNISGSSIAASMVVFLNGDKNTSEYKRFRIRYSNKGKPNDFAAMKEVISRRLNHPEWGIPNLIIVDGGKGQITSAISALNEKKLLVPVIGLAKRQETIITTDFKQIVLAHDSKALHLMMRIRDEAHRFALAYHKKLRSKAVFANG